MIGLQKKQLEKFEFENIQIRIENKKNKNIIKMFFIKEKNNYGINDIDKIAYPLTQKNEKREFKTVESALNFIKLFERKNQEIKIVDLREN